MSTLILQKSGLDKRSKTRFKGTTRVRIPATGNTFQSNVRKEREQTINIKIKTNYDAIIRSKNRKISVHDDKAKFWSKDNNRRYNNIMTIM